MGETGALSPIPAASSPVVPGLASAWPGSKNLGSSIPTSNFGLPPLISPRGFRPLGGCGGRGNRSGGPSLMGDGGPSSI